MACGIYALLFNSDNLVYIGKSKNIHKRYTEHIWTLNNGQGSKRLQNAFDSYGIPRLEILLSCSEEDLDAKEAELIEEFDSVNSGLNSFSATNGAGMLVGENAVGAKHSNDEYIHILKVLVNCPSKSFDDIERDTGVSKSIIAAISAGTSHTWLKDSNPLEYLQLEALKGYRLSFRDKPKYTGKYTEQQLKEVLLALISKHRHQDIEAVTGVSLSTIRDISSMRRHTWLENACPDEYNQLKQIKGN